MGAPHKDVCCIGLLLFSSCGAITGCIVVRLNSLSMPQNWPLYARVYSAISNAQYCPDLALGSLYSCIQGKGGGRRLTDLDYFMPNQHTIFFHNKGQWQAIPCCTSIRKCRTNYSLMLGDWAHLPRDKNLDSLLSKSCFSCPIHGNSQLGATRVGSPLHDSLALLWTV